MSQQPTQICDNCLKPFPESKIATHFGYCRRNIKKCPKCGEMYDINFQEEHEEEFHKMGSCKYCKKQVKPNEISKHQENCQSRTKYCQYCDLDVPMKDYPSHLRQCQARTKNCDKCSKPIANKDFLIHQISCPGFVEQIKPSITTNNQYQDYNTYLKQQKRKEELRANEYKPASYQQPKREGSKAREMRPQQQGYGNSVYTTGSNNNNGLRQAEIKKQSLLPNKPTSTNKPTTMNYADIKMNKNAVNYGDQRIPASNIYQKDLRSKVESNSNKQIDSNKNIGSGKIIQNKYAPSFVPQTKPYEYKPSVNTYGTTKDVPKTVIQPSSSSNGRASYQQPQVDVNSYNRPGQNVINKEYPKVQDPYKKEVPSSKDVNYGRRQEKPREAPYRHVEYQPRRQQPKRQQPRRPNQIPRTMPKTNTIPAQQYNSYQANRQYIPQQPSYNAPTINDHQMDQQLQQAIMASLGQMSISSPKQLSSKPQPKQSYKIDQVPPELLENDMMNESFYGKQQALWEEFERNKKRR